MAIWSCRPSAWDHEISAPFGLKSGCDTASLSVACQSSALGTPFSDITVRATRSLLRGSLSVFQMSAVSTHMPFSSPVGCQLSLQRTFSCQDLSVSDPKTQAKASCNLHDDFAANFRPPDTGLVRLQ